MHVLVTSNFDDDLIKNEETGTETSLSLIKPIGYFSDIQGQLTPHLAKILTYPSFYVHVLVACNFKGDRINSNREKMKTSIF